MKGRVYNAAVRTTLLYGCETWPVKPTDIKRLVRFDHRCLRSLADVWWEHRLSSVRVRLHVFSARRLSDPFSTIISRQTPMVGPHVAYASTPTTATCVVYAPGAWMEEKEG
ncbi:unnamed protein product [Dicrocoelium dendriticum]|nr:unnamed protein product [Dicrocoelium dendriticum]